MYHKSRRRRQRFYPEFYDDDEIEVKKETELNLEPEENIQDIPAESPVNYNDLLYPNNLKPDSVFNQLENMQKDYIKKKLEVSRANNINLNPDITGSDKIINRNEAEKINENNNEIRIEIPDDMYTGEIAEIHNAAQEETLQNENLQEQRISEVMQTMADINDTENASDFENLKIFQEFESDIAENPYESGEDYILTPDSDDGSDNLGEAVPTFEHITEPEPVKQHEYFAEQPEPVIEQAELVTTEPEPIIQHEAVHHNKLVPFDKARAIEYAHRWALDRNPNFLDFDELGGDCTNYISQILLAGGCKMDHTPVYGWYYSSGSEKSPSWTGVEQLYNYLMKEKEHGCIAKEISAEEAEAGDIVQLSFNGRNFQHTPFIVEVSRAPGEPFDYDQIKICAHSFDSQNRALDTYQWRKIRFIRILGYLEK